MEPVDAEEALTYAVSREMGRIYLVILAGVLLQSLGTGLFLPTPLPYSLGDLLRSLFGIVGFVASFVGSVALLYKLVVDGPDPGPGRGASNATVHSANRDEPSGPPRAKTPGTDGSRRTFGHHDCSPTKERIRTEKKSLHGAR